MEVVVMRGEARSGLTTTGLVEDETEMADLAIEVSIGP